MIRWNVSDNPTLCLEGWRLRQRYLAKGLDPLSVRIYVDAFVDHVRKCAACTQWAEYWDALAKNAEMPDIDA